MALTEVKKNYSEAQKYYGKLKSKFINEAVATMKKNKNISDIEARKEFKNAFKNIEIRQKSNVEEQAAELIMDTIPLMVDKLLETIDNNGNNELENIINDKKNESARRKKIKQGEIQTNLQLIEQRILKEKQRRIAAEFFEDNLKSIKEFNNSGGFDYTLTKQILVSKALKAAQNRNEMIKPTKAELRAIGGDFTEAEVVGVLEQFFNNILGTGNKIVNASGMIERVDEKNSSKSVQTKMDIIFDIFNLFGEELSGKVIFPSDVDKFLTTFEEKSEKQDKKLEHLYGASVKKWLLEDFTFNKDNPWQRGLSMGSYNIEIKKNSLTPYIDNLTAASAATRQIIGARNVIFATGSRIMWTQDFIKSFLNQKLYLQRTTKGGKEYYIPHKHSSIELNVNKWEYFGNKT